MNSIENSFYNNVLPDYVLLNAISKGFSIHTYKALQVWEMILNTLISCFEEYFGEVIITHSIPAITNIEKIKNFYGDNFSRLDGRIPSLLDETGINRAIVTDALPFLVSLAANNNCSFSTYTVVRPRNFGVKSLLREEFIRYFQITLSTLREREETTIKLLENTLQQFFSLIRISTVIVDRYSDSYYCKKSCYHAIWLNGNVESVLQCGILKTNVDGKTIIDIGGAQRLLVTFLYANSDSYGLFLPKHFREFDLVLCIKTNTIFFCEIVSGLSNAGIRVKVYDTLGLVPLRKIKTSAIDESAIALVVQREVDGKEFYDVYNRDTTMDCIYSKSDLNQWIMCKYNEIEYGIYRKQQEKISSRIEDEQLVIRGSGKKYKIVNTGLFYCEKEDMG